MKNYINHVALVLDASGSMSRHRDTLIKVTDNLIRDLALASEQKQQETRVSIYSFDDTVRNLVFDMDVMRLPSIADLYQIGGMTALIDGTMQAQVDLATTSQIYGEHGFLTYVLTDGVNNVRNQRYSVGDLAAHLQNGLLPLRHRVTSNGLARSTVAFLVPDRDGRAYVERLGAPSGNVLEWDVSSDRSVLEVGEKIKAATTSYMDGRTRGVTRSTSVFDTSAAAVNTQTVTSTLDPISGARYRILLNAQNEKIRMDDFMVKQGITFTAGHCFYEWKPGVKTKVQANKQFMVVNKKSDMAYTGTIEQVRALIGLPMNMAITDSPAVNKEWSIFVQSSAPNRAVLPFQRIFVLDPQAIRVTV